jgi:AcrR family transcriptional regulator
MFGKSLDEKKAYIAKIAGEIFYAKGFMESSLQDISAKGNLSKGGIYHYFKSKEEILLFILLNNTEQGITSLKATLNSSKERQLDSMETFKEIIRTYANHILNNKKVSLLVLRERHQLSGKNRKSLVEQERIIFKFIRKQIEQISNIKKKFNINLIVFQLISMIHWMGYWFDEKGTLSREQAIEQSICIILDGILEN